jgi:hypothetical protein
MRAVRSNPPRIDRSLQCSRAARLRPGCNLLQVLTHNSDHYQPPSPYLITGSSLLALHEPYLHSGESSSIFSDQHHYSRAVAKAIAGDISSRAKKYLPTLASFTGGVSIWCIHIVYQVCIVYIRLARETGDADALGNLRVLKEVLALLSLRWKCAGVYYA